MDLIATNGEEFPWDDIRLPEFIVPIRYDIELTPNLTSKWVKGERQVYLPLSCSNSNRSNNNRNGNV